MCLLFLIPPALAVDKGIFYILDEKFIDNISELPYSPGNPDKQIQRSGNIEAWIDIVGFNKMMRENGIDYVPGNPADHAIVQYDAKGRQPGIFDSIEKTVSFSQSGNSLTAVLNVKLKWHTESCDENGCFVNGRFTETAAFQDTETTPQTYPRLQNLEVNLTQYNNSLYENIGIRIVNISGLNRYTIQYRDNVAEHRIKKAHIEKTAKGIYFANVTPAEFLDLKGRNISRYGRIILLNGNLSKMDSSDIRITGSNLYETRTADAGHVNITRLEFKPEKELTNPVSLWFMSVMAVMAGGFCFYVRRIQWLRNM